MSWTLIDTTAPLETFCQQVLAEEPAFVAVDCEFLRQTTYWPYLGLIQLATPKSAVIIDPVVNKLSLEPLRAILQAPSITKVFHSGHQDIEILYGLFRQCPAPIFDTQIAAAFTGLGEGLGYEKLVNLLLGVELNKDEQFTNWLKRPLRQEQLTYAIHDVLYLREIYVLLRDRLSDLGRLHWPEDHFLTLSDPKTYTANPETAWQKIRAPFSKWQHYSILWDLAAWREQYAQDHNMSRNLLADNRLLIDLSGLPFLETDVLKKTLASYRHKLNDKTSFESFYPCYQQAHQLLEQENREQTIKTWMRQSLQYQLTPEQKQTLNQIRAHIKEVADNLNLPMSCLANRRDIESFVSCPDPHHKLLTGWRGDVLGPYLVPFSPKEPLEEVIQKI